MKKIFIYIAITLGLLSCNHKDSLWQEVVEDLDERVETLEMLCAEMNTNIIAMQTIVDAVESNDFITSIVEVKKDGKVVGYTITFGKHDPITIYHGQDGKDGQNGQNGADGKDGITPVIGVAQDMDGVYYWTLNGEWLLDDNDNKLPVSGKDGQNGADGKDGQDGTDGKDGITPLLKIENGYWYISYDNGATWTESGKATGDKGKDGQNGDSMFQSVTQDENYVYFTLADGTVIKIAKGSNNSESNEGFIYEITFDSNGGVGYMPKDTFYYGKAKELDYSAYGKDGFAFVGWNSKPDGTGAHYNNGDILTIEKNMILYAQWEAFNGVLPGKFSVAAGKYVQFASGNLQYQASTNTWRFAENQYDYIGSKNAKISETNTDWIDLFGYGTSGKEPYFPYLTNIYETKDGTSGYPSTYYYPNTILTIDNGLDWGVNEIESTTQTGWRTLTGATGLYQDREWLYITYYRSNAKEKIALANIQGVNGLLLLPDEWKQPNGILYIPRAEHFYLNEYNKEQWIVLASNGAVFLPAAGYRRGTSVIDMGSKVIYWSSSLGSYPKEGVSLIVYEGGEISSHNIKYGCFGFGLYSDFPLTSDGCAVRLAIDVE